MGGESEGGIFFFYTKTTQSPQVTCVREASLSSYHCDDSFTCKMAAAAAAREGFETYQSSVLAKAAPSNRVPQRLLSTPQPVLAALKSCFAFSLKGKQAIIRHTKLLAR